MSDENIKNEGEETKPVEVASEAPQEPAVPQEDVADAVAAISEETKDAEATVVALPHRDIKSGMVVRVHEIIKDLNAKGEERERVQVFEGTVLGVSGAGIQRTMTVRKVSEGVGVEKIFPVHSPVVERIELVRQMRVRQSRPYYIRSHKKRLKEVK